MTLNVMTLGIKTLSMTKHTITTLIKMPRNLIAIRRMTYDLMAFDIIKLASQNDTQYDDAHHEATA
jgi:hypothetical protein